MSSCAGIKANGERCRGIAASGTEYCPAHDPARREARREAASKAGRSRPVNTEIAVVKSELHSLAGKVRDGKLSPKVGAVVAQIWNVYLRGCEVERRIKETEELEERLDALESHYGSAS